MNRYLNPYSTWQWVQELLLGRNRTSPLFRLVAVIAGFLLLLAVATVLEFQSRDLLMVLRHWFLPTVVLFAVLYGGARRLNDLFNLDETPESIFRTMGYLWNAIFGDFLWPYETIEIKDGALTPRSKKSRVSVIGGPGLLKIHLGNAALFELVNNASVIYSAKSDQFLHGFERLREEVIDLRDQIRDLGDLPLYTRDGIPVTAVQAQVAFRVYSHQPRTERNPYPYEPHSIRRLIYGQLAGPGYATRPWTDMVTDLARAEIAHYIGQRRFKDLIAQKQKGMLPPPPSFAGDTTGITQSSPPTSRAVAANPRRELTLSFYTESFARRCRQLGVELIWIGVGMLQTPPEVSQELIDSWQKEFIELTRISATTLENEARTMRRRAFWDFSNHLKEYWHTHTRIPSSEPKVLELRPQSEWPLPFNIVSLYAIRLREMRRNAQAPIEPEIDAALDYLDEISRPRTLGGNDHEPERAGALPGPASLPSDTPGLKPGPDLTQGFGPPPPPPR
ncbi:MAG: hypothetical protein NZM11_03830 [Anaerolineales bacterium]|nr:hypothetical protein [Anaerolineales bacterium]